MKIILCIIDYLYSKTVQMEAAGKFKKTKKQKKKDKSPGTIFDWENRDTP